MKKHMMVLLLCATLGLYAASGTAKATEFGIRDLQRMKDLLDKSPVFADFKAVKENHVYTTDKYMYQATDIMGEMIRDIHKMLTGADDSGMLFLKKIEA